MFKAEFKSDKDLDTPVGRPLLTKVFNSVQEEICSVIEGAGLKVDGSNGQLLSAIKSMLSQPKPSAEISFKLEDAEAVKSTLFLINGVRLDSSKFRSAYFEIQYKMNGYDGEKQYNPYPVFTVFSESLDRWVILKASNWNQTDPKAPHWSTLNLQSPECPCPSFLMVDEILRSTQGRWIKLGRGSFSYSVPTSSPPSFFIDKSGLFYIYQTYDIESGDEGKFTGQMFTQFKILNFTPIC